MAVPQKIENSITARPSYTTLGQNPKDALPYHKNTSSTMFIATLFVIARTWKQPRCLSTEKWIENVVLHLHKVYYQFVGGKNDIMKFPGKLMKLQKIILSEVTQAQKDKHGIVSLISEY